MASESERSSQEPRRVAILAADGVEEVEVTTPRDALQAAGAAVSVLTPDGQPVRGYHYIEPGNEIAADGSIGGTGPGQFDAAVVPGGLGGPDTLRTDESAVGFVHDIAAAGKPIGVICHGPWVLIEADVLAGRSLTCVPALRTDVTNAGAAYVDEAVFVDRSASPELISGRNFEAASEFATVLVRELCP